ADTALLRVGFHGRNLVPLWLAGAWFADQLINGGHCALSIVQIRSQSVRTSPSTKFTPLGTRSSVYTSKPKRRMPEIRLDSAAPQLQRTTRLSAAVMRTRICFV